MSASLEEIRLRLPTGREASIVEGLRFCYDLSETDTAILMELLKGKEYTVDELAEKLKLSKATVNRSLTKLVEIGFVSRTREKKGGAGRPKYKYYVQDPEKVIQKIISDFEQCARTYREVLQELLSKLETRK